MRKREQRILVIGAITLLVVWGMVVGIVTRPSATLEIAELPTLEMLPAAVVQDRAAIPETAVHTIMPVPTILVNRIEPSQIPVAVPTATLDNVPAPSAIQSVSNVPVNLASAPVPVVQPPVPDSIPEEYKPLVEQARTAGTIRVIVGVAMPFKVEGLLTSPQAIQSQRSQIQAAQSQLLSALPANNMQAVVTFNTIPFMALTVDEAGLKALIANSQVTSIEEDRALSLFLDDSTEVIGADIAWAAGYEGTGQTVAILDTGVQTDHPFFGGRVVEEACYSLENASQGISSVCPNGQTSQTGPGAGVPCSFGECFHGTHVAGIAAGNGPEFDGVARDADIIAIQITSRVDNDNICGSFASPCPVPYASNVIQGLERVFALRSTYTIAAVNMSLGSTVPFSTQCNGFSPAQEAAIANLKSVGIATIAGSGNSGANDGISHPACLADTIAVGATDDADNIASFSNSSSLLSLLAPGVGINSSMPGSTYGEQNGTSMATPHVTGAWAVIREALADAGISASIDDILHALQETGPVLTDMDNEVMTPRIQIDAAINYLIDSTPDPKPYPVVLNEFRINTNQAIELFNAGGVTANLTGWQLQIFGTTQEHTYNFPANFMLPAGSYVTLHRGTGTNNATNLYLGNYSTTWAANGTGAARLLAGDVGIDFARWGSSTLQPGIGTAWTGLNPPGPAAGQTLGRDASSTDFNDGSDFSSMSPSFGTQNTVIPPANDNWAQVINLTSLPYESQVNTRNATIQTGEPLPDCSPAMGHTVWYRYDSPAEPRTLILRTTGSTYDTAMALWTGSTLNTLTEVACNDDILLGRNNRSQIVYITQPNTTYYVQVGGYDGASGTLLFKAKLGAINSYPDDFDDARIVDELDYIDFINTDAATEADDDPNPGAFCTTTTPHSVWYQYTAPHLQGLYITTVQSDFDVVLSIWQGGRGALEPVTCAYDLDLIGFVAESTIEMAGGETVYFMVSGQPIFAGADVSGNLVFEVQLLYEEEPTPEPNQPPVARIKIDNDTYNSATNTIEVPSGTTEWGVLLDASQSSDSDGSISNYHFVLNLPSGATQVLYDGVDPIPDAISLPLGFHSVVLRVTDNEGATGETLIDFRIAVPPPVKPTLLTPTDGAELNDQQPEFTWQAIIDATEYQIQIDDASNFVTPVRNVLVNAPTYMPDTPLPFDSYFWRVRAFNDTDVGPWSDTHTFTISDIQLVDVGLTKVASGAAAGQPLTYTLTATNHGPNAAQAVQIVDTLPTNVSFTNASTGCNRTSNIVTCTIGELAVGASAVIEINVQVNATPGPTTTNTATITTTSNDSNATNNQATVISPILNRPGSLSATAASRTAIQLNWTNASDINQITSFYLEYDDGAGWQPLPALPANMTSYTHNNLLCGHSYSYRARAFRPLDGLFSTYSNTATTATAACPDPVLNTIGLYNAGMWQFWDANDPAATIINFAFGPTQPGWRAITGDWNGDGVDGIGLYKDGVWLLRDVSAGGPVEYSFTFGVAEAGWLPIAGDWNGDDVDGIGLYRNGNFIIKQTASSGPPDIQFTFGPGEPGWLPVAGDWNGSGSAGIGLYKEGMWLLSNTVPAAADLRPINFGQAGWQPIAGDWNQDGSTSVGIYNTGQWHLRNTNSSGAPDVSVETSMTQPGWQPIANYRGGVGALHALSLPINTPEPADTATAVPTVTTVPVEATATESVEATVTETPTPSPTEAPTIAPTESPTETAMPTNVPEAEVTEAVQVDG